MNGNGAVVRPPLAIPSPFDFFGSRMVMLVIRDVYVWLVVRSLRSIQFGGQSEQSEIQADRPSILNSKFSIQHS